MVFYSYVRDYYTHYLLVSCIFCCIAAKKESEEALKEGDEEDVGWDNGAGAPIGMAATFTETRSLEEVEESLNADQRRVYDRICVEIDKFEKHRLSGCTCLQTNSEWDNNRKCLMEGESFKPLRLFVSGVGGTGKSFLIEAVMAKLIKLYSSPEVYVFLCLPVIYLLLEDFSFTLYYAVSIDRCNSANCNKPWDKLIKRFVSEHVPL